MKSVLVALALIAASPAAAAVTYDFTAFFANGSERGGFIYTAEDFLTNGAVLPLFSFTCKGPLECGEQVLVPIPAEGERPATNTVYFWAGPTTAPYDFAEGAFAAYGTYYSSNADFSPTGRLIVSEAVVPVPEPGEWAMMAAGLAVVGGIARRRKRT